MVVTGADAGPRPEFGPRVWLRYTGMLLDGTIFGTSSDEPSEFRIGAIVKGLEEMLLAMQLGERRTVLIPPPRDSPMGR